MSATATELRLEFRPLTADDLPLLHAWVQRPHVAQWWDAPSTLDAIRHEYLPDPEVTVVHTDPAPHNGRAIRCYEKAGFRQVGVMETPDGPALLMRCPRP
jgi:RimJ/RimL family protein N-acetyltransferase